MGFGDEPGRRYGERSPSKSDNILGLKIYFYEKYVNNFTF